MGQLLATAFSYDSKTKRVGLYILTGGKKIATARKNGKGYVVKTYVTIPGSYAEFNGKKI